MAKVSGITTSVTVDDSGGVARIISNDVTSITAATPRGVREITGLDKSAVERILLLADGNVTINGIFNTAANNSHDVFKTVPTQSGTVTRTVVIGYPGATLTMEMVFSDYSITRAEDGSLVWSAPGALANGTAPAWT